MVPFRRQTKNWFWGRWTFFDRFLTILDFCHGFIPFIHWFMIDPPDLWLISPPRGGWDSNPRPCGWEPPRARPLSYTRHPLGHLFHGFHWFMIDSLIYDWFMIDPPAGGAGNRTCDLVVESRRVQDHWAIPVTPSKWYPKYPLVQKQINHNLPTTFRIHPPPSEQKSVLRTLDLFGPFSQNPKIPKASVLANMIFMKEDYEKMERP